MSNLAINSIHAANTESQVAAATKLTQATAKGGNVEKALATKEKFTEFVGTTFFGQMIKAMRTSVGKSAYFHGGQAEEVFRGQLDQTLAEHMTKATAEQFAEPMFNLQHPEFAALLKEHESQQQQHTATRGDTLDDLARLGRR